jgi:hypothetical protein
MEALGVAKTLLNFDFRVRSVRKISYGEIQRILANFSDFFHPELRGSLLSRTHKKVCHQISRKFSQKRLQTAAQEATEDKSSTSALPPKTPMRPLFLAPEPLLQRRFHFETLLSLI